jgi:hypothetical protein
VAEADADGSAELVATAVEGAALALADGDEVEQAGRMASSATSNDPRREGRMGGGLVRVIADVGGLDRWQRTVAEQPGLASQELELGSQAGGRVWLLEEVLLAGQLDLDHAGDGVARRDRVIRELDRLEHPVE